MSEARVKRVSSSMAASPGGPSTSSTSTSSGSIVASLLLTPRLSFASDSATRIGSKLNIESIERRFRDGTHILPSAENILSVLAELERHIARRYPACLMMRESRLLDQKSATSQAESEKRFAFATRFSLSPLLVHLLNTPMNLVDSTTHCLPSRINWHDDNLSW